MKRLSTMLLSAGLAASAGAAAGPGHCDEIAQRVAQLTEQVAPVVVEMRRDFHAHPELSNREERTARIVAERLRKIGVDEVKTGVAHHGVVGLIRGKAPGPTVALRADMDALPIQEETGLPFASKHEGVMHACGHDAHTAMLLGAAEVLCQMRDAMHGNVKLIFQPAEEGPPPGEEGGAKLMIDQGVLGEPDVAAVIGMHVNLEQPTGQIGCRPGALHASSDRFQVTVRGRGVHAAMPWEGIDPIVAAAQIVTAAQTIASRRIDARQPVVVSFGVIRGGTASNIIPDRVELQGTIRTHDAEVRRRTIEELRRIVEQTASALGATGEIEFTSGTPVNASDPELLERLLPALERAAGAGNVVEIPARMGAEDFAFFAEERPSVYVTLGARNEKIGAVHPLHSSKLTLDEDALPLGVRAYAGMALRFLGKP